jgi:hypothetical protein
MKLHIDVPTNSSGYIDLDGTFSTKIKLSKSVIASKTIKLVRYSLRFAPEAGDYLLPDTGAIYAQLDFGGVMSNGGHNAVRSATDGGSQPSTMTPIQIEYNSEYQTFSCHTSPICFDLNAKVQFSDVVLRLELSPHAQAALTTAGKKTSLVEMMLWLETY